MNRRRIKLIAFCALSFFTGAIFIMYSNALVHWANFPLTDSAIKFTILYYAVLHLIILVGVIRSDERN